MDRGEDFSKGFGQAQSLVNNPAVTREEAGKRSAACAMMVDWLHDVVEYGLIRNCQSKKGSAAKPKTSQPSA